MPYGRYKREALEKKKNFTTVTRECGMEGMFYIIYI